MRSGFISLKNNVLKNKILIENFTFLSVLQVSNLILFLITIPYLFRVLGSTNYGLIVFAQTVAYYFSILINFGFNLTATRDISVNRNDTNRLSEIVSSVLLIKFLLFLLSLILMVFAVSIIPFFRDNMAIFLFSMAACLSDALFPVWYFQGIEKMKYITFINVTTRVIAIILVFSIIDKPDEYVIYPLILGVGTISGAVIALFVVFIKHSIVFRMQRFQVLKKYLKENVTYLVSNVSTQIYGNANKVIIGSFIGMAALAYYDIADKIVYILRVPYSLLGQTLFPRMSREKNKRILNRMIIATVMLTTALLIMLMIFSGNIVRYFSGTENPEAVYILRILSISLLPMIFSLFYGDIYLITLDRKIEYLKTRFYGMLFYFVMVLALFTFDYMTVINVSVLTVLLEFLIGGLSFYFSGTPLKIVTTEQ